MSAPGVPHVCLMGADGSGKSSLLNAVSGLVLPRQPRADRCPGADDVPDVRGGHRPGRGLAAVHGAGHRRRAAEKYINFVLSEQAQALNARHTYLVPVNREVKLAPEVAAKLPAGEETLKRLVTTDWNYVTKVRPQWVERWNREITN